MQIGCGDGRLTAALHASNAYLVQGLDVEAANVQAAREHLHSLGLYGPVSIDHLRGDHLPYIDNLVNLVVSEDLGAVPLKLGSLAIPAGTQQLRVKAAPGIEIQSVRLKTEIRVP